MGHLAVGRHSHSVAVANKRRVNQAFDQGQDFVDMEVFREKERTVCRGGRLTEKAVMVVLAAADFVAPVAKGVVVVADWKIGWRVKLYLRE